MTVIIGIVEEITLLSDVIFVVVSFYPKDRACCESESAENRDHYDSISNNIVIYKK